MGKNTIPNITHVRCITWLDIGLLHVGKRKTNTEHIFTARCYVRICNTAISSVCL